jgi:hypothetical protein
MNFKYRCISATIELPNEIGHYLFDIQPPRSINDVLNTRTGGSGVRLILNTPDNKFYFIVRMIVNGNDVTISASINDDTKNLKNIPISRYEFFKLLLTPEVNPLKIDMVQIDENILSVNEAIQRCLIFVDIHSNYHNLNELIEKPIFKEIIVEEVRIDTSVLVQTVMSITFNQFRNLIIECYCRSNNHIYGFPDCETIFQKCKPTINKKSARNI